MYSKKKPKNELTGVEFVLLKFVIVSSVLLFIAQAFNALHDKV